MPECKVIKLKRRGVCAGDLDRKIDIKTRTIDTPGASVDFGHTFTLKKNIWAGLQTSQGRQMFFTTNMDRAVSHVFYIRWFSGLTSDDWIVYKSENYDIVDVENLDERDEFYAVYCNVRGANDTPVNNA